MSNTAIRVEGLGKRYRVGTAAERHDSLRELLVGLARAPGRNLSRLRRLSSFEEEDGADVFWALRDIDFEVKHGEAVGIIGRNGAGKSTLLKILSRIVTPSTGRASVYGRVGSLLEVGTGFHPELTGRDNIFLNGSILGMDRDYIERHLDAIIDFSGIERFIDTPVKRYSSGMYTRLAFAVAAHMEPEILIVDEVLAVGDVVFQRKCLGKMGDVTKEGRTVLFVSHQMSMIQALCTHGMVLSAGALASEGPVLDVIGDYLQQLESSAADPFGHNPERSGGGPIRLIGVRILDPSGRTTENVIAGQNMTLEFDYESPEEVRGAELTFTIYNRHGAPLTNIAFPLKGFHVDRWQQNGTLSCTLKRLPLLPDHYRLGIGVYLDPNYSRLSDHIPAAKTFSVVSSEFFDTGQSPNPQASVFMVDHEWNHQARRSWEAARAAL